MVCLVSTGSGAQVSPAGKLKHHAKDLLSLLCLTKGSFILRLGLVVPDLHHGPGTWVHVLGPGHLLAHQPGGQLVHDLFRASEDYVPEDERAPCRVIAPGTGVRHTMLHRVLIPVTDQQEGPGGGREGLEFSGRTWPLWKEGRKERGG